MYTVFVTIWFNDGTLPETRVFPNIEAVHPDDAQWEIDTDPIWQEFWQNAESLTFATFRSDRIPTK